METLNLQPQTLCLDTSEDLHQQILVFLQNTLSTNTGEEYTFDEQQWQVSVWNACTNQKESPLGEFQCDSKNRLPIVVVHPSSYVTANDSTTPIEPLALAEDVEISQPTAPDTVSYGALCVNMLQRRAWHEDHELQLTPKEFKLLWLFINHPKQVFSRHDLVVKVWGDNFEGYEHTVSNHINRLRKKLTSIKTCFVRIETVWGVGYKLDLKTAYKPY